MAESKIEWTERTWNPVVGCSILTPGCTNCYAMKMASRIELMHAGIPSGTHYAGTTKKVNGNAVWTGKLALAPEHILLEPLKRKKPTTYFVNSMGDLFHEDCPDEWIVKVLDVIRRTSYDGGSNCGAIKGEHTYQVLTKRAARMASFMPRLRFDPRDERGLYLSDDGGPSVVMKNLWFGVSAERQQEADERIPHLLQTPAAIRFVSAEPLLGPIDLRTLKLPREAGKFGTFISVVATGGPGLFDHNSRRVTDVPGLDWIIVGGESGHSARPMHPDWARSIRDQCDAAGVPMFFKQWGEWEIASSENGHGDGVMPDSDRRYTWVGKNGKTYNPSAPAGQDCWAMARVGKKAAGRLLDGIEHNAMPAMASA